MHSIIRILAVARACRKYLEFETNASGEFLGIEFMQRINWDALVYAKFADVVCFAQIVDCKSDKDLSTQANVYAFIANKILQK